MLRTLIPTPSIQGNKRGNGDAYSGDPCPSKFAKEKMPAGGGTVVASRDGLFRNRGVEGWGYGWGLNEDIGPTRT